MQVEASEDDMGMKNVSSVASALPSPLLPTPLPCVSASDEQTTLNPTQMSLGMVESACAAVAIAAGVQLLKESTPGHTSLTNVIQQQIKLESEELIARTQKHEAHEQVMSSCVTLHLPGKLSFLHQFREHQTISFATDCSDRYTLSSDKVDSSTLLTGIPQQSSTDCRQQVGQLDQSTLQPCGSQVQVVSNIGQETKTTQASTSLVFLSSLSCSKRK